MKPSFFDILRRLLFWKSCPRPFQFGAVEAACVYCHSDDAARVFVPSAEKQAVMECGADKVGS